MRSLIQWRSRPAAENLLLLAIGVCLAIAVIRLTLVVVAAPSGVIGTPTWTSWWGGRVIPNRGGGDYFAVISHTQPMRTVGAVVGVVVERDRARGIAIDRVLTPFDETALYGAPPGAVFTRPDGTTFRSTWAPIGRYAKYFTDVPVQQATYAPFLDAAAFTALASRTHLTERSKSFFTADPVSGGSGTWELLSRQGAEREYLLVPVELAPTGGVS